MNAPLNGSARAFPATIWAGKVEAPGLYIGTPEQAYHADPTPEPSLSSHVAKIVLKRSLLHAKAAHPRLADPVQLEEDEDEDDDVRAPATHLLIGQAAHSLVLGAGAQVVEIPVKSFRTKEAKERRKLILRHGGVPLKSAHYRAAHRMAAIAKPVFAEEFGGSFIPEAMLCWQERGIWRRGLLDGVSADMRIGGDYKTSGRPCPPDVAAQFANANGYPFQERFYNRGLDTLDPAGMGRRRFFFLFQEVEYPHAISIVESDEANRSLADEHVAAACNLWDRAMLTGEWPGYSRAPYFASPKPWSLAEWEARAMTDETITPMEID